VIAEGVGSIVEHGGGRLLIPFYDLPWVPGLNEKELEEVREIFVDAYLHPEKYEAERNAVSLIKDTFIKDPEKLTEKEKELQKLAEKALKGDEKAMEKIKETLEERASQVSENLRSNIELLNKDPNSLSEEEREEQNQIIMVAILTNLQKIEDESDKEILQRLYSEKSERPPTEEEINNLFKKYKSMALEWYQHRQLMYSEQIPAMLKNIDKINLFAHLSI
jgi:hypothetical protein